MSPDFSNDSAWAPMGFQDAKFVVEFNRMPLFIAGYHLKLLSEIWGPLWDSFKFFVVISSKTTGMMFLNLFSNGIAISRICGWAAGAVRNLKKCRHSRKFNVIIISVFKELGRTDRASCGVTPSESKV
jgi:hypothetical protein